MAQVTTKVVGFTSLICFLMLLSEPANALRCGTRLVKDGMLESEVIRLCGEPVSTRQIGWVLRSAYRTRRSLSGMEVQRHYYGHGFFEELVVTELVFNFGPRKLMRLIRFEGGRVVNIETAGYGYLKN